MKNRDVKGIIPIYTTFSLFSSAMCFSPVFSNGLVPCFQTVPSFPQEYKNMWCCVLSGLNRYETEKKSCVNSVVVFPSKK